MSHKTLLTMAEAAEMVGLTRPTFYRKVDELGISIVEDGKKKRVDVSELIRVFGSDVQLQKNDLSKSSKNASTDKKSDAAEQSDIQAKLESLETALEREKKLREEMKDEVAYFKEQIALEKEEKNKITLLLEDQRQKDNKTQDWEKALQIVEARIANQEKVSNTEKELARKIRRQNAALKKALAEEKNKTLWQKLFG